MYNLKHQLIKSKYQKNLILLENSIKKGNFWIRPNYRDFHFNNVRYSSTYLTNIINVMFNIEYKSLDVRVFAILLHQSYQAY